MKTNETVKKFNHNITVLAIIAKPIVIFVLYFYYSFYCGVFFYGNFGQMN